MVCAAHPDDTEIGCGGSLTRYKAEGAEILSLIFSYVNPDIQPPDIIIQECNKSLKSLAVQYKAFNMPMRTLSEYRQEILQKMLDYRRDFDPDLVFIPTPNDLHSDHYTVAREGMRAFKGVTTFGYELPWNNITFHAQAFVKLEVNHILAKQTALAMYESQKDKPYMDKIFVFCWAKTRGVQVGCNLAEAFEVIRWVD